MDLPDAGAGEQSETLSGAAGGESVHHAHAEIQALAQPGAQRRVGRRRPHRAKVMALRGPSKPVHRPPERVDDPAQPGIIDREMPATRHALADGGRCGGAAAGPDAFQRTERHGAGDTVAEADDFRRNVLPVAGGEAHPVAGADMAGEAGDVDGQA